MNLETVMKINFKSKKFIIISIIIAVILALAISVVVHLCVHENDDKKGPEEDKIYENTSDVDITIEDIEKLTLLDFPDTSVIKYAMNYMDPEYITYEYCNLAGELMVKIEMPTEDTEDILNALKETSTNFTSDNDSEYYIFENTPHAEKVKYKDAYKSYADLNRIGCGCGRGCEYTGIFYQIYIFKTEECTTFYASIVETLIRDDLDTESN